MSKQYEELNEILLPCNKCGGKVKIHPVGTGYDTFYIKCEECGSLWHINSCFPIEVAKIWGIKEENNIWGTKL